ncbi:tetratricopeptide repeat protein [Rubrobacter indicoceani]|uniref:tetratricopeptide repeat protein n=1 Tax=Rubrobacter indicoceani TaxID=2051957 RepID=UPI0013C3FE27|nr:tetratricopeptide repeat protein [Rubrobacter indicoceani]
MRIKLFGEFRVWRSGEIVGNEKWDRQKTRSLLKLLLTCPGRVFSRDEILEALWTDSSPASAERSLRVTVSLLRRALEPNLEHGPGSRYIISQRPGYMFDRESACEVDTWEFEKHLKNAEEARKAANHDEAIRMYRLALDLLQGEFLAEEKYEDWAFTAREDWRKRHLVALSELSECLAQKGRYTEAIESCERAMALDRYREDLRRRLILYHYCAGEQTLALRAYRCYARRLKEELGASPSPELEKLKDQVEAREVPGVDGSRRYPKPRHPLKLPYSLSRTHFVGRDREYALLVERLGEAGEGSGGAVAVEGEAGVGKTRLVEEFLGYARTRGVRVLSGRCYEQELSSPLEPILDALGPPSVVDKKASELLWATGLHENSVRLYRTLTQRLIHESSTSGLVLFVDDVQWADAATLDFLTYAARRLSGERVLLVMTYRREEAPALAGWIQHLADRRSVKILNLERLSYDNTLELLSRLSSRSFDGLRSMADFLYRESEGNPFYTVEYLRWLIESGTVQIDARRRISGLKSEALREDELPSSVRSLLRARFSGLDDQAKEFLNTAAVVGRSFDLSLISAIGLHRENDILALVELLMDSSLIVEAPEKNKYHFSHDKLRQALYKDIGSLRQRNLHLKVARTLEKLGSEPAELAHHYVRAQAWPEAFDRLIEAADKAKEGYAWKTALDYYSRALEIVDRLPDSDKTKFGLLTARENLLEHMDRQEERAASVREMFELAQRLGDRTRLAEVHIRRIGTLMALQDPEGASRAGEEALKIFRELQDPAGEARAHREIGYVRWMTRDYAGALEANLRSLWLHRELGYRKGEAGDAGNIAHAYRGLGDFDSALRWNEEAVRIDSELGDKLGESFRLNSVASIHRERGNLKAALSLHVKSLSLLKELGAKNLMATQHINCGRVQLSLGAPEGALEHFRAAARLGRETGYARDEGYALVGVGVCLEQSGASKEAEKTYRQAINLLHTSYELSEAADSSSGKADALALLAKILHRSLYRPGEALDAYEEAAGIYRRLNETAKLRKLLMGLAGLRWQIRDFSGSAEVYNEALELARAQSEAAPEAAALASLSVVYREAGDLRRSLRAGKDALGLLRELEDLQAEAYVQSSLAESYRKLGHYPSALSCLKRSLRLRQRVGDAEGEVRVLHDMARVSEPLEEAASKKGLEKAPSQTRTAQQKALRR